MVTCKNKAIKIWTLGGLILVLCSCIKTPMPPTVPTTTAIPSLTVTLTQIPSLTSTVASETPTKSTEQLFRGLVSLLQKANCKLPCLMGITPDVSTVDDVYKVLLSFQGLSKNGGLDNIEYPLSTMTSVHIDINIDTSSFKQDMIDHVIIITKAVASSGTSDDLKIYMDADYQDLIHRYTLPMILRSFGRPTQVLMSVLPSTGAEPGVHSFFDLGLAYPDKGFYINYFTFATAPKNHYEGCPSFSFVSIWSEAPVPGLSNEDLITKLANWSPEFFLGFKPLEQVTNMTIDQFVQIFSQPDLHCIDTPKSAWPTQ